MNIKEIESKIKESYPEIRISGLIKKRKETLEEFLKKFFTKWNNEKNTILVIEKEIDTEAGCRRSIGDIYMICKYYYPHCTLNQVKKLIFDDIKKIVPRFRSSYCYQTKRRMFYQGNNNEEEAIYNEKNKDEFGLTINDWKTL